MKGSHVKIDDTLIISRIQYKELLQIKPDIDVDAQFFPLVSTTSFEPFFDNLPTGLGFSLSSVGNQIISTKVERGYFKKNIEDALSKKGLEYSMDLLSTLNMRCPLFYQMALLAALDDLYGEPRSDAQNRQCAVAMEWARIAHHTMVIYDVLRYLKLYALADLAHMGMELMQKIQLLVSRVYNPTSADVSEEQDVLEIIAYLMQLYDDLETSCLSEQAVRARLARKFTITLPMAAHMGLTGLFLRSNRHNADVRGHESSQGIYQSCPKKCVGEGGDGLARFSLRFFEIKASLQWLKNQFLATRMVLKPIRLAPTQYHQPQQAFACGEIEGPEGVIKVSIFVNQSDQSLVFRVRSPAYFIAQAIPYLVRNREISDLPLLLFSLGIAAEEVDL